VWHERPGDEKRAYEIHGDRSLELVGGRLLDPLDEKRPGVVDHDVRDAELGEDAADRPLHGAGIGDVAAQIRPPVGRAVPEAACQAHDMGPGRVQPVRHRAPDAARGAGDEREPPAEGSRAHSRPRPPCTSLRNSSRVLASCSSAPRSALVTVLEFCFSTPRIIMQRWYASITTPTPRGSSTSMSASATWSVSRSCTWSRRANTSITRGILERPTKRPFGR